MAYAQQVVTTPKPTGRAEASASDLEVRFSVEKFHLSNGLTVLLHQDRSIPLISYHTWYRVGSRNESEGVTGAAHMLEHMMFKGTKKTSRKDWDQFLHRNGIRHNAFTSWDYTGYYQNLPPQHLDMMMKLEVDRMHDLALRSEDLVTELQVVREERRWRIDNQPVGRMMEVLFGRIFSGHPYEWPVIGWAKDIEAYTVEKLRYFYQRYYGPNNAVLVLAGDFDIEQVREKVKTAYGKLPVREVTSPRADLTRNQMKKADRGGSRQLEVRAPVGAPNVALAYLGLSARDPDSHAADLMSSILANGGSSRLHKSLVYEKQTSTGVGAESIANIEPGAFVVFAGLKPGVSRADALTEMRAQVVKLRAEPVSQAELRKVRNQSLKSLLDGWKTVDGKASALAWSEIVLGNYQELFSIPKKVSAVTSGDILRVAGQILDPSTEVQVQLLPEKNSQGARP